MARFNAGIKYFRTWSASVLRNCRRKVFIDVLMSLFFKVSQYVLNKIFFGEIFHLHTRFSLNTSVQSMMGRKDRYTNLFPVCLPCGSTSVYTTLAQHYTVYMNSHKFCLAPRSKILLTERVLFQFTSRI